MSLITEDSCRICLTVEFDNTFTLENVKILNLTAKEAFKDLFNIEINNVSDDDYQTPKKICEKCQNEMKVALSLKIKALQAQLKIIDSFIKPEPEPIAADVDVEMQTIKQEPVEELPPETFEVISDIKPEEKPMVPEVEIKKEPQDELKPETSSNTSNPKPFQCTICYFKCDTRIKLTRHVLQHRMEEQKECKRCCKRFQTIDELLSHNCASKFRLVCYSCHKKFDDRASLTSHKCHLVAEIQLKKELIDQIQITKKPATKGIGKKKKGTEAKQLKTKYSLSVRKLEKKPQVFTLNEKNELVPKTN